MPGGNSRTANSPPLSVFVSRVKFLDGLLTVTVASGTTAPVLSVTVPDIEPFVAATCARALAARRPANSAHRMTRSDLDRSCLTQFIAVSLSEFAMARQPLMTTAIPAFLLIPAVRMRYRGFTKQSFGRPAD